MLRLFLIFLSFVAGWVMYMVAMMTTTYDGFPSLIIQPILAAIISGLTVGLCLLFGLMLRLPGLKQFWHSTPFLQICLLVASLGLMIFGSSIGLSEVYIDEELNRHFVGLNSAVALSTYILVVFTLANWPIKRTATPNCDPVFHSADGESGEDAIF